MTTDTPASSAGELSHLSSNEPAPWAALNDADLATAIFDAEELVARERARFDEKILPVVMDAKQMRAALMERLRKNEAVAVPHADLIVEIREHTRIDKRISELRALEALVPADELKKALYLHQPEPEWRADARYLEPLAKKYGGQVRTIIRRGIVRVVDGVQLIIKAKPVEPKNVTGSADLTGISG